MSGIRNIARHYGGIVINGVTYIWDYKLDRPVREDELKACRRAEVEQRKRDRADAESRQGELL